RRDRAAPARPLVRSRGHRRAPDVPDHECQLMNKKILILGGGVAGSSMAYYLTEKGYDVTVVERNATVGGLARTCTYSGHPYEFGPHIWFWPGGKDDPVNATVVKLTN